MTLNSALVAFLLSVSGGGPGSKFEPLHLKVGDVVSVVVTLEPALSAPLSATGAPLGLAAEAPLRGSVAAGDYVILSDGAMYGPQFGQIMVAGKTLAQAQVLLRTSLKRYVNPKFVYLTMKAQKRDFVYVVGEGSEALRQPLTLQPGMTLRQVLSTAAGTADGDELDVRVYRDQKVVEAGSVRSLLATDTPSGDMLLAANDVVAVVPTDYLRIWVNGAVKLPSRVRVPLGSDVYQVVSAAGGVSQAVNPTSSVAQSQIDSESTIVVKRGDQAFRFSARQSPEAKPFKLEAGDSVSVLGPQQIRVTISGEVAKPSEYPVNSGTTVPQLIAVAGGPTLQGTLKRVLIYRKGDMLSFDLAGTPPQDMSDLALEDGDLVFVTKNERLVYVLGEVVKSGAFGMEDNRHYRLTDVLAQGQGLLPTGTLRRVFLSRPGPNGKALVTMYNLDEYLKDGREASNPEVFPGDAVLFTTARVSFITAVNQIFSSFVLAATLRRL